MSFATGTLESPAELDEAVIAHLADRGEQTVAEIKRALDVGVSHLQRSVEKLEEQGRLVRREGFGQGGARYAVPSWDYERADVREDLKAPILTLLGGRRENARGLLRLLPSGLHATVDEVRATCEDLRFHGRLASTRIGEVHIYRLTESSGVVVRQVAPEDVAHVESAETRVAREAATSRPWAPPRPPGPFRVDLPEIPAEPALPAEPEAVAPALEPDLAPPPPAAPLDVPEPPVFELPSEPEAPPEPEAAPEPTVDVSDPLVVDAPVEPAPTPPEAEASPAAPLDEAPAAPEGPDMPQSPLLQRLAELEERAATAQRLTEALRDLDGQIEALRAARADVETELGDALSARAALAHIDQVLTEGIQKAAPGDVGVSETADTDPDDEEEEPEPPSLFDRLAAHIARQSVHGPLSIREAAHDLQTTRATASRYLARLLQEGKVERHGDTLVGYSYSATPSLLDAVKAGAHG